jgi:hypothetical protein
MSTSPSAPMKLAWVVAARPAGAALTAEEECGTPCSALGAGWSPFTAGSNKTSLCAVLVPMAGVSHWVPGYTDAHATSSTAGSVCALHCASDPCYQLWSPQLTLHAFPALMFSLGNAEDFPVRCACSCPGFSCNEQAQDTTVSWLARCRAPDMYPAIHPRPLSTPRGGVPGAAARVANSSVYGHICRSSVYGTRRLTGWLDESADRSGSQSEAVCRFAYHAPVAQFEVLCVQRS